MPELQLEFLARGFGLARLGCCRILGSASVDEGSSPSHPVPRLQPPLPPSHSLQINHTNNHQRVTDAFFMSPTPRACSYLSWRALWPLTGTRTHHMYDGRPATPEESPPGSFTKSHHKVANDKRQSYFSPLNLHASFAFPFMSLPWPQFPLWKSDSKENVQTNILLRLICVFQRLLGRSS